MLREGLFEHHRRDSVAVVAAGGTPLAQGFYGPVPEGYAWYVELAAFGVLGNSHTAIAALAVSPDNAALGSIAGWDFAGLQAEVAPAVVSGQFPLALPLYVPANHWVRLLAFGGSLAAADLVNFSFQTAVHQLNPRLMMSPDDMAQVKAAHERVAAGLSETAVAGRRAV